MKSRQQPRILFVGPSREVHLALKHFGLTRDEGVAVTAIDEAKWSKEFGVRTVLAPDELDCSNLQCAIISAPLARGADAAFAFLRALGVDSSMILGLDQPGSIVRQLIGYKGFSVAELMQIGYRVIYDDVFLRRHFGYGVMLAAEQARRLMHKSVTIVETGVWQGLGLLNLCEWCDFLRLTQKMEFQVVGFDTGAGLPPVSDWRDHPELWSEGEMAMPDVQALRTQLPEFCELIIGDVDQTVPRFIGEQHLSQSPLGFVSLDVDFYRSTVSALKLFEAPAERLLPAVIVWVDDSYINVMHSSYCGEALAIREFNERNALRKIDQKIVRTNRPSQWWHHAYWFAHIFDHPVRQGVEKGAQLIGFHHIKY